MQAHIGCMTDLPQVAACLQTSQRIAPKQSAVLAGGICCDQRIPALRTRDWRHQHNGAGCHAAQAAGACMRLGVPICSTSRCTPAQEFCTRHRVAKSLGLQGCTWVSHGKQLATRQKQGIALRASYPISADASTFQETAGWQQGEMHMQGFGTTSLRPMLRAAGSC